MLVILMLCTWMGVTLKPAASMAHLPSISQVVTPPQIDNVLSRSLVTSDSDPNVSQGVTLPSSLSQGQLYYESGQLTAAMQSWRQAVDEDTHPLRQALSLSYLSLVAQDLGEWSQAEDAIMRSLRLLADNPNLKGSSRVQAQVLNVQGRLYLKQGKPETAWETWQEAERSYTRTGDVLGSIGAQINQAQALQTMGLYRRASVKISDVMRLLESQPDSEIKAVALRSLGNVLQTTGSLEESEKYLAQSITINEQLGNQSAVTDALFDLANTQRLIGNVADAQQGYLSVEAQSTRAQLRVNAQLSRFRLLLETEQWSTARKLLPDIYTALQAMPASRESINSRVNLVESLLARGKDGHQPMEWLSVEKIALLLADANQQAQLLQDDRAQSLALGSLGKVYGYTRQWADSQRLEEQALQLSQRISAKDLSYRWHQQLGKAYYQQGNEQAAIESYSDAVDTLGEVRRDLLATNSDVQYSFRETVEPVYRELVALLLLPDEASQPNLLKAREVIEDLQLAELENYFRSACIDSASEYIDKLDSEAAVLYPIVLSDRVEVIASVPNQPLRHYRTWQTEDATNRIITELFENFNPALSSRKRLMLSKQIYDWLIQPAEAALNKNGVSTLVFVLDGKFRNIPMAALYDGSQYLLEKYSVALTPGLKLLGPHFQDPKPLQALMLGLTEARNGFSALPGVKEEIEQVAARVNSEVLFDREFTKDNLEAEIKRVPFPVLHLATHGQFSSDLEKTFLLAWDQKLTLGDLDDLLRSRRQQSEPIELMVLSACQTAEGDDRAALGLAGMAIRSGARSTLATLWAVNDESTADLMTQFYQELSDTNLSKAEALRLAQIKILQIPEYSHPFYWSPFVLIGNWLS
ncbi:MAG: CHAT domain-containing protein [Cyanobacteria bacterium P01_D01_bin.105]